MAAMPQASKQTSAFTTLVMDDLDFLENENTLYSDIKVTAHGDSMIQNFAFRSHQVISRPDPLIFYQFNPSAVSRDFNIFEESLRSVTASLISGDAPWALLLFPGRRILRLAGREAILTDSTPTEWKDWHSQSIPFRNLALERESKLSDDSNAMHAEEKEELLEIFVAATTQPKGSGSFDYRISFNSGNSNDAPEDRSALFSGLFAFSAFLDWLRTDLRAHTERQLPMILAPVPFSRSVITPALTKVAKLDDGESVLEVRGVFPIESVKALALLAGNHKSVEVKISLTPLPGTAAILNAFSPDKARGPAVGFVGNVEQGWKVLFDRNSINSYR
jgi:hypothetical protein